MVRHTLLQAFALRFLKCVWPLWTWIKGLIAGSESVINFLCYTLNYFS